MNLTYFHSSRVAIGAIFIVVVGMETFIVQPGFVQGLVEYAGYTEQSAGYIVSFEMFGIAASTIIVAPIAQRLNWRVLGTVAAVALGAANLASVAAVGGGMFGAIRFLAGLGSGILIAYGYAVIGMTQNPDRKFGYLITSVLVYGALGLLVMPAAFARVGMRGVLIFLSALGLGALTFIPLLPAQIANSVASAGASVVTLAKRHRYMGLAAVFAFFLAQGAIWAYLFLIGLAAGVSERDVANGLTLSQLTGIAGALTAAGLGLRMRHSYLLTVGVVLGIAPLMYLFGTAAAMTYTVAVCVFNFSANLLTPLLMAVIAGFDATGKLIVYAVAAQMLALAAGPAIAAGIVISGNYDRPLLLCEMLLAASLALILPPVSARRRIEVLAGK